MYKALVIINNQYINMKHFLLTVILFPLISIGTLSAQDTNEGVDIIKKMLVEIPKTQRLQYSLKTWERFNQGKKEVNAVILTKWNRNPLKIYLKNIEGANTNVEVLWVKGEYDNKAYLNKLWGLKLDPYGSLIRKDQHHTLFNTGFDMIADILGQALKRAEKEAINHPELSPDAIFKYDGDVNWAGKSCYKIVISDPEFKYVSYTVKEGETLDSYAKANRICGYLVIDNNSNVNGFDDFDAGNTIKVPTSYAKNTVLYIDKQSYMPIVQIMSDEKGPFERYEFHDLKINPTFQALEFTEDFAEYDF